MVRYCVSTILWTTCIFCVCVCVCVCASFSSAHTLSLSCFSLPSAFMRSCCLVTSGRMMRSVGCVRMPPVRCDASSHPLQRTQGSLASKATTRHTLYVSVQSSGVRVEKKLPWEQTDLTVCKFWLATDDPRKHLS